MNVKTTIVLALVLIVAVGAFLIFRPEGPAVSQEPSEEKDTKAKPLYELAQLVKFEIERSGKPKMAFEKPLKEGKTDEYDDWRMVAPVKAKATNWEVNSFADKFKAPKCTERFTPGQGGFPAAEKIGLAAPKVVVTVTDKDGATRKVQVGDRVFGGEETYIRVAGESEACVAKLDIRDNLKKDVDDLRSKDLFDFDKAKVVQVDIAYEGKTYTLVKGEGDKWVIDAPVKSPADKSKVDGLLSDIRYLKADEFIESEPKSLTAFELDKPKATVTVTIEEKIKEKEDEAATKPTTTKAAEPKVKRTSVTVCFGGASDLKGEKFYCKLKDEPWVVSVSKSTYEKVQPKLDEWRDAKVAQAKVLDATKIDVRVAGESLSLEKKAGTWKMTAPKTGKAEQSAVSGLLNALNDLKAGNWVDAPKGKSEYGLDKPQAEIVLTIKGKTDPVRILVGGNTKSGLLTYVHQAASGSIAVVKVDDAKKLLTPAMSYRDRSVMQFVRSRADRIELTRKGTALVLAKEKGAWKMLEPVSADVDTDAVNDVLGDLSVLKASQIAGEGDLAKFGLDKPELKVSVRVQPKPKPKPKPTTTQAATQPTSTQAKPATAAATKPAATTKAPATKPAPEKPRKPALHVLLVSKKGEKVYAALPKGKLVYELNKTVYDNLTAEMHDRKPLKFETSEVQAVHVVGGDKPLKFAKKDDEWSYEPDPLVTVDKKKVEDLIKALHDLKVERYASYAAKDLKTFGLDAPALTVTVRLEGKPTLTMLLAKPDKDGKRNAALKAEPGKIKVFVVTKADVEKFAKKISDFVKK